MHKWLNILKLAMINIEKDDLRSLHYNRNATGLDSFLDCNSYLLCETLLHLQSTAESFSDTGEFG
jgi:hypothetical protein